MKADPDDRKAWLDLFLDWKWHKKGLKKDNCQTLIRIGLVLNSKFIENK
jgi:hypothetical protein